jgi:penicillin-binding protein 2
MYFSTISVAIWESKRWLSTRASLGKPTGIDLPNEAAGTVPSPEWKQRRFHEPWFPGETISVAIGQGALTVTPLQLAYAVGGITSGGVFYRPRLVSPAELRQLDHPSVEGDETQSLGRREVPLAESTVQLVTDAIYAVVNQGGTGGSARVPGLDIAGKTGTAQVASLQLAKARKGGDVDLRDNGWFVGLAPRRNPEIVVAVLYESGEHGAAAAPAAREVIKAYYNKKKLTRPAPEEPAGTPEVTQARPSAAPAVGASGASPANAIVGQQATRPPAAAPSAGGTSTVPAATAPKPPAPDSPVPAPPAAPTATAPATATTAANAG